MRPFNKREVMITPTPKDYAWNEFSKGVTGLVDTSVAGKVSGVAGGGTVWVGKVTGTSCFIRSDRGNGGNQLWASIDNGTFFPCVFNNDRFTIFENRPQQTYRILIQFTTTGYNPYFRTDLTNSMTVHGISPSVTTMTNYTMPGDGNNLVGYSANYVTISISMSPPSMPAYVYNVSGSGVISMKLRCAAKTLVVIVPSPIVMISIDGGMYTQYNDSRPKNFQHAVYIPCDGNLHTYHIWQDSVTGMINGYTNPFIIGSDALFIDCGDKRRLDQYGSSSTAGAGATAAQVDTMITAASLGLVGSTYGISGENLAAFALRVDACLAQKVVNANDICVLQLGANDVGSGTWNATQIANYNYSITAMLNKGYGKIFCRGLPTYNGITRIPENNSIISIVNAFANPKVIYINTDTWSGITVLSDTHPTTAGYITLANYATAAYAPLI